MNGSRSSSVDESADEITPTLDVEYASEQEDYSSDEEFYTNRVGNVPLEWYDDYDHIGYDISGKPVSKPAKKDAIDKLIASRDDPLFRRQIFDEKNNETITLTNRELNLVKRMMQSRFINETRTFEAEPDYNPYFTSIISDVPLAEDHDEPKRRFMPSKGEKKKVIGIIRAIRQGKIKVNDKVEPEIRSEYDMFDKERFYLLWDESDNVINQTDGETNISTQRKKRHVPAPKLEIPGHALSYHPPKEYLFNEEEEKKYEQLYDDDKNKIVKPQDFEKLRFVPAYQNFLKERFERCLDLYMCTRVIKDKLNIDPESLVPKLPKPKDLRPFPNVIACTYLGHSAPVRSIDVFHSGEVLASVDSEGIVKIWEVESTRCLCTIDLKLIISNKDDNENLGEAKRGIKASFNQKFGCLGVSYAKALFVFDISKFLFPGDQHLSEQVLELLRGAGVEAEKAQVQLTGRKLAAWSFVEKMDDIPFLKLTLFDNQATEFIDFCWHPKGLYLITISDSASRKVIGQVMIHHLAKQESKKLFGPNHPVSKIDAQRVCFHPNKPIIFIATKQNVFCQDLIKKQMVKRLISDSKWISTLAVHSSGDHLVVGGYDKRVNWFDLDLKNEPFKSMKYHSKAVRSVCLHPRYPLMASGSDEGSVHVFHSRVFSDLVRNPLIVPVKNINAHYVYSDTGVFQTVFHPKQPWVFSCGGDKSIHLFQNIP